MILYLDTSNKDLVLVELRSDQVKVISQKTEKNQRGSQVLLPLITKILEDNDLEWKDLIGVEVNPGPGSFTGLRVGASVAQALGFALNIPVNGELGKPVDLKYT